SDRAGEPARPGRSLPQALPRHLPHPDQDAALPDRRRRRRQLRAPPGDAALPAAAPPRPEDPARDLPGRGAHDVAPLAQDRPAGAPPRLVRHTTEARGLKRRMTPERTVLVVGLLGGLLFVAATPPFQAPDEPNHFARAYQISEGVLFPRSGGADLPESVVTLRKDRSGCV